MDNRSKERRVEDRVAIFIDGSNLYHGLKNNFRRQDLDFTAFIAKLCGNRPLFRTYYYNVLQDPAKWPDAHKEQQEFLDILNKTPYLEIRLGGTKVASGIPVEKGIDVMLATDLQLFAWNNFYDIAILVSGDSDFVYAVQVVKNIGKHVEVAYFENAISKDLLDVADNKHQLNAEYFKGLWAYHPKLRRGRYERPSKPPIMPIKQNPLA
jgi:uncharacterized LabA/DUF88 family protein